MIISGIDTLEFELDIENYVENAKELVESLSNLKEEGVEKRAPQRIMLNGINFEVALSGAPFYKYRLECNDFFIYFMHGTMKNNYPIKVKFLSGYLWSFGYVEAYHRFIAWFESLLPICANRISRVDIACDNDEFEFKQDDLEYFVTRAKLKRINDPSADAIDIEGKRFTGFTFGRGCPLMCRIYNKSIEITTSKKTWFNTIYLQNGSDLHNDVWRIEYQMRRKFLKECGVTSMSDFIEKKSNIWAYLTEKWLVMKSPDDSNQTRRTTNKNWCLIQKGAKDYYASPIIRKEIKVKDAQGLLDQITGCTLSLSAICNYGCLVDASRIINDYISLKLEQKGSSFLAEKEKRQNKYLK